MDRRSLHGQTVSNRLSFTWFKFCDKDWVVRKHELQVLKVQVSSSNLSNITPATVFLISPSQNFSLPFYPVEMYLQSKPTEYLLIPLHTFFQVGA